MVMVGSCLLNPATPSCSHSDTRGVQARLSQKCPGRGRVCGPWFGTGSELCPGGTAASRATWAGHVERAAGASWPGSALPSLVLLLRGTESTPWPGWHGPSRLPLTTHLPRLTQLAQTCSARRRARLTPGADPVSPRPQTSSLWQGQVLPHLGTGACRGALRTSSSCQA